MITMYDACDTELSYCPEDARVSLDPGLYSVLVRVVKGDLVVRKIIG